MTAYVALSSCGFSHDMQLVDSLEFLRSEYPDIYAGILSRFPEYGGAELDGGWIDTDALGVDPEWSSWLTDAVEDTGIVRWEDGEPYGRPAPSGALWDAFMSGYLTCAVWADVVDPENDYLPDYGTYTPDDIAPESLATMTADARDFYAANSATLGAFCRYLSRDSQSLSLADAYGIAGHDLWLTRNGHGAGFWDAGAGRIGGYLSDMARPMGGQSLYSDENGRLHIL